MTDEGSETQACSLKSPVSDRVGTEPSSVPGYLRQAKHQLDHLLTRLSQADRFEGHLIQSLELVTSKLVTG